MFARITGLLGGRAAEEVIFGNDEVTTGAGNDIERVTELTRQMVTKYGMSDLGPLALEGSQQPIFIGGDAGNHSEYSQEVAAKIDEQVRKIVLRCYENAKQIINDYRPLIDALVDLLVEKETIDGDVLRKMVDQYNVKSPVLTK